MSVRLSTVQPKTYTSPEYSYSIVHKTHETKIYLQMHNGVYSTSALPSTSRILSSILPTIFNSECYNDLKLSFRHEVKKTEIAHLFEHILLEYLCMYSIKQGAKSAVYNGVTSWDWYKHPQGSFEITIDSGIHNTSLFILALAKTQILFEKILHSSALLN